MPIHSGLRDQREEHRRAFKPKAPEIIQPQEPGEAIAASINAVSGLIYYIQQILAGPMRGSPDFFKQYLREAYKSASDLLKQLTVRLDGTTPLDGIVKATTELLAIAAEHDVEATEELAATLEHLVSKSGVDPSISVKTALESAKTLRMEWLKAEAKVDQGDLWIVIGGAGELKSDSESLQLNIHGMVPASSLNLTVSAFPPEVENA